MAAGPHAPAPAVPEPPTEVAVPPATRSARRGSPGKRRAITRAALAVFARDGYTRASIDAIAREAEVSTRTIYNHFTDKADLFASLIVESATRVAEAQIETIHRHLDRVTDLERDLIEFGRIWARQEPEYADHFALVRQIAADSGHIPPAALQAWQQAGPLRVRRELALCMGELADQGLLDAPDPERAAIHLVVLATGEVTQRSAQQLRPLDDADIVAIADAGVQTFLRAYRVRR